MNLFFKTLTGTFAVLLFQATPLPAAETGLLHLAMVNTGCRPGTSPVQLDDGSSVCAETIEVSGGGGGGGNPALNLPDRRGGGSSDWAEPQPHDGGAGLPDPEWVETRKRAEKLLKAEKKKCDEVFHGQWKRYKPSTSVYRARCEYPSQLQSDEIISRLYDGMTGLSFRQCYYKANVRGDQDAVRCEYPDHSPCAVPPQKRPPMCTESEPE